MEGPQPHLTLQAVSWEASGGYSRGRWCLEPVPAVEGVSKSWKQRSHPAQSLQVET